MLGSNDVTLSGGASRAIVEEEMGRAVLCGEGQAVEDLPGALWASALSGVQVNCE